MYVRIYTYIKIEFCKCINKFMICQIVICNLVII